MEMDSEIILALSATGLLAALMFRSLISSMIKINDELQETIQSRAITEDKNFALQSEIQELKTEIADLKHQLELQSEEIKLLRSQLVDKTEENPITEHIDNALLGQILRLSLQEGLNNLVSYIEDIKQKEVLDKSSEPL